MRNLSTTLTSRSGKVLPITIEIVRYNHQPEAVVDLDGVNVRGHITPDGTVFKCGGDHAQQVAHFFGGTIAKGMDVQLSLTDSSAYNEAQDRYNEDLTDYVPTAYAVFVPTHGERTVRIADEGEFHGELASASEAGGRVSVAMNSKKLRYANLRAYDCGIEHRDPNHYTAILSQEVVDELIGDFPTSKNDGPSDRVDVRAVAIAEARRINKRVLISRNSGVSRADAHTEVETYTSTWAMPDGTVTTSESSIQLS